MEVPVVAMISCVGVSLSFIWNAIQAWRKRQDTAKLKKINATLEAISAVVIVPSASGAGTGLVSTTTAIETTDPDEEIFSLFDTFKLLPDAATHDRLIDLINRRQAALITDIQSDSPDDIIAKSRLIATQFAEMIALIKGTLNAPCVAKK